MEVYHVWVIASQLWLISRELIFLLETPNWQDFYQIPWVAMVKYGSLFVFLHQFLHLLKHSQLCKYLSFFYHWFLHHYIIGLLNHFIITVF